MSVSGGLKPAAAGPALSWPRWTYTNIARGVAMVVRPPRAKTKPVWRAYARLGIGALVMAAVIVAAMIFIDVPAIEGARRLPQWLVTTFNEITDFGRSGWFLIPIGFVLVVMAALASPALPRLSQLVLAAAAVRLAFVFTAIALPGLFSTIIKRVIGRGRPFVGDHADPFLYMQFVWRPDYASLPSGHATNAFAAAIAIGLIWPRTRPVMWIYALIIALSRVDDHRAPSERRDRRCLCRRRRRAPGARLVRRPSAGILHQHRRQRALASRTFDDPDQEGCAAYRPRCITAPGRQGGGFNQTPNQTRGVQRRHQRL